MIKEMFFVTNNHILVQFDGRYLPSKDEKNMIDLRKPPPKVTDTQTAIFKTNGFVVEQGEVKLALNCEIVGRSYLANGTLFLVTRNADTKNYNVLRFDINGQCKLLCVYENLELMIYEHV